MYATASRSDVDIQQDVQRELRWDTRFEKAQVGVAVKNGIVALTGTVENFGKKWAASEAAHRVTGVLDVVNDLEVKLADDARKTDVEIAKAVRHTLEWDVFVPDQKIRTTVTNGWVTLEGEVEFLRQREDSAAAVRVLAGVKGVTNSIVVREKRVQPADVRRKIEEALERRADREAERIAVSVEDGGVTLSGRVHSWMEKEAVLGTVSHAPGVAHVRDHLHVDPFH
ncbi:MAG TPA: BON domain-containing protein [Thermoanaerobaculia bacterium]|nr:BON domain-containing protein [Thermoanaerobaculia bacterium]